MQTCPRELIQAIFCWIPFRHVQSYRLLCRSISECLNDVHFATLNLRVGDNDDEEDNDETRCFMPGYLQHNRWMEWPEAYQVAYAGLVADSTSKWIFHCCHQQRMFRLPVAVSRLYNLREIWIEDVPSLKGELPTELGQLQHLEWLVLSKTGLTGSIPHEIQNCISLRHLDLSNSYYSGELPMRWESLISLEILNLSYCRFEGSIPSSIGSLSKLRRLYLSGNLFSGSIPCSLGSLKLLQELDLSWNLLEGNIPRELETLQNLVKLDLSGNERLVGLVAPTAFPKIKTLKLLV
ncbi:L domain-like protein [Rhizoclosmatium globosum]|uniref:L domain-like protein n=1 Tax=Rhizoclosmatium globosum TaxID=329046 RepID=A0A1Y2C2Z1_9FUNG|nr:L domain-like protein [Rhizoclosmatium globosum]|eukprot:ORY41257.1 L domain-like protein [Rhizoclosmatium globosum]